MAITVSLQDLDGALGSHISALCPSGYARDSDEHCAHFVSHMLSYGFGVTCRTMSSDPKGGAANIRVQELFPRCRRVGTWGSLPPTMFSGLVFIGNAGNVDVGRKMMSAVPRLHVGIFYGLRRVIYHYSNKARKVVSQSPAEFSTHFAAPDNALFWGEF